MKVICIDGKPTTANYCLPEGVPLEVQQSELWSNCYTVNGYELDPVTLLTVHWGKRRFIPCSDIDEMEMVRENQMQSI